MTLPNFLVVGAQRAGTSLLHRLLLSHTDVFVPQQRKELHFFDRYYARGTGWYSSYFSRTANYDYSAVGEITPDYLATHQAPERITGLLPEVKVIVILRDPIERTWSWYNYSRRNYNDKRTFSEFINEDPTAIEWSLYHKYIERYLQLLPKENFLVMIFESLISDPGFELNLLSDFLKISQEWPGITLVGKEKINAGASPRYRRAFALARRIGGYLTHHDLNGPVRWAKQLGIRNAFGRDITMLRMSNDERDLLKARFNDDVHNLRQTIDRDFTYWQL